MSGAVGAQRPVRIGISGIAWDPADDRPVADLLARFGVDAIDVAPSKYFPDPAAATDAELARLRGWWADRGIEITGMQSLLFGTTGLNVFGPAEVQQALLDRLAAVFRVGAGLGAVRLVFGSPRNRDRTGLDDATALERGAGFFARAGDLAASAGVQLMLEPNPTRYGANFMTTGAETAQVVRAVGHPAIGMQLDTGAAHLAGEDVEDLLAAHADLVGHVHLSDVDLAPLGGAQISQDRSDPGAEGSVDQCRAVRAISAHLPGRVSVIEMLSPSPNTMPAIEQALRLATTLRDRAARGEVSPV